MKMAFEIRNIGEALDLDTGQVVALTPDYRITPACAGNTFFRFSFFRHYQDHPRMCG